MVCFYGILLSAMTAKIFFKWLCIFFVRQGVSLSKWYEIFKAYYQKEFWFFGSRICV